MNPSPGLPLSLFLILAYFFAAFSLSTSTSNKLRLLFFHSLGVSNIGVGFLSAIVDNVPVMSAILKANPTMGVDQWMLVTLTAGIDGSLISFGSAAGVGVMGKLHGIYTFSSHMRYAWTILVGYIVSVSIWYVQFIILGIGA